MLQYKRTCQKYISKRIIQFRRKRLVNRLHNFENKKKIKNKKKKQFGLKLHFTVVTYFQRNQLIANRTLKMYCYLN